MQTFGVVDPIEAIDLLLQLFESFSQGLLVEEPEQVWWTCSFLPCVVGL